MEVSLGVMLLGVMPLGDAPRTSQGAIGTRHTARRSPKRNLRALRWVFKRADLQRRLQARLSKDDTNNTADRRGANTGRVVLSISESEPKESDN